MEQELNPQIAQNLLRVMMRDYDDFSSALIEGTIPELAPPFDSYSSHKGNIISYLKGFYDDYLKYLKKVNCLESVNESMKLMVEQYRSSQGDNEQAPSFDLYNETVAVCNMINGCLQLYYKGLPAEAFELMEKTMTRRDGHLSNLLPQIQKVCGSQMMYRVRKGNHPDPRQLFHVPFEARHKCDNYRFSIAGVPALYGAASLKTALLETDIRPGDEVSVAMFEYGSGHQYIFIDLTIPRRSDYGLWERYSMILFYPLIVACGLKVKEQGSPFRPEYVIPQLFYQFIRSHSPFDGIIFNSTKYVRRDFADHNQCNYVVFLPDSDKEMGYSDTLASRIEVCGPISFKYTNDAYISEVQKRLSSLNPSPMSI